MLYLTIRDLHVLFAVLSLAGFLLRGWWMLRDSPLLGHRLTRILPHVNDSLLLLAGIALVVLSRQYPLAQPWLTAKLGALLLYILLGTLALKRAPTKALRALAFIGALLTFGYMAWVAVARSPWPLA